MDTGVDCRIRATESLVQAKREPEREAHLISMAESWLRLAVQADQIQALMDHSRLSKFGLRGMTG